MKEDKVNEILEDLFNNTLNLEKNLNGYVKKLIHPFDNWKDYQKYGDTFLKLYKKEE